MEVIALLPQRRLSPEINRKTKFRSLKVSGDDVGGGGDCFSALESAVESSFISLSSVSRSVGSISDIEAFSAGEEAAMVGAGSEAVWDAVLGREEKLKEKGEDFLTSLVSTAVINFTSSV
jgi:hypothetical protein